MLYPTELPDHNSLKKTRKYKNFNRLKHRLFFIAIGRLPVLKRGDGNKVPHKIPYAVGPPKTVVLSAGYIGVFAAGIVDL